MKTLPLATTISIVAAIWLKYVFGALSWWHARLYDLVPAGNVLLRNHTRYLTFGWWGIVFLLLALLCFVVKVCRDRSYRLWIRIVIALFWALSFGYSLSPD